MKNVTIVYASDEKFLLQTYVSIYSVLKARKAKYYINFVILVPVGTKNCEYNTRWTFSDYSIVFEEIADSLFDDLQMTITHITKPTYYRLLIPEILKSLDKCIYLDGDTICCSDIIQLYEEQIEDNYIGGCMGELLDWSVDSASRFADELDVSNGEEYINAGVLLMNLTKLREISNELLSESRKNYRLQDQDVINKCCYGKIKILHPRYNLYSWTRNMYRRNMTFRYNRNDIKEAMNNPCIIHYANEYTKPWRNDKCILHDLWWNHAERALPQENIIQLKRITLENLNNYTNEDDILFAKVKNAKKIIIFGFSKAGFEFADTICLKYGKEKIQYFCDNDKTKWKEVKNGYSVCKPQDLIGLPEDFLIVVTSQGYWKAIQAQLLEMGIPQDHIVIYRRKKENYYLSLDKN